MKEIFSDNNTLSWEEKVEQVNILLENYKVSFK